MQNHTERVDIRALVDDIAAHLLRRQILRRTEKLTCLRDRGRGGEARDPEVGDLRTALGVEQHVLRLQIAM